MKLPKPKYAVVTAFLIMALYFFGIGVLSWGYKLQAFGSFFVSSLHGALVLGLWRGEDWSIWLGKYLSFIDLIFSLLWMMLGVIIQGATLFFIAALILVLLSDSEVEARILGRD